VKRYHLISGLGAVAAAMALAPAEPPPLTEEQQAKLDALHEVERQQRKAEREERDRRAAHERKWGPGRYLPHQGSREMARRAKRLRAAEGGSRDDA